MSELYLNKIKSLLREKHITQEQVCKKIGIQQPTLSVMLSGRAPLSKKKSTKKIRINITLKFNKI